MIFAAIYLVIAVCYLVFFLAIDVEKAMKGVRSSIRLSFLLAALWPLVLAVGFVVYARNANGRGRA